MAGHLIRGDWSFSLWEHSCRKGHDFNARTTVDWLLLPEWRDDLRKDPQLELKIPHQEDSADHERQNQKILRPGRRCQKGVYSSMLFCCCDKQMTKSNLWRKRFISSYRLQSIIEGSQGRNLKRKPQRNAVYLLPVSSSATLYSPDPAA